MFTVNNVKRHFTVNGNRKHHRTNVVEPEDDQSDAIEGNNYEANDLSVKESRYVKRHITVKR